MTLSNGHCEERGDVAIPNTQEEIASLRSHDITLKNSDPDLSGRNHAEGPHMLRTIIGEACIMSAPLCWEHQERKVKGSSEPMLER